jgi:hypothetical protein
MTGRLQSMDLDEFSREMAARPAPPPQPDWYFSGLDDLTWSNIPGSFWIGIILFAAIAVKASDWWPQINACTESRKKND